MLRIRCRSNAWFTFSSRVLVETFGEMWTRQDIRDIFVSFDSGLIYQHVSESFEMRREQVESVEDETNVPFTLSFLSCLMLSRWECKPSITVLHGVWLLNPSEYRIFEKCGNAAVEIKMWKYPNRLIIFIWYQNYNKCSTWLSVLAQHASSVPRLKIHFNHLSVDYSSHFFNESFKVGKRGRIQTEYIIFNHTSQKNYLVSNHSFM